LIAQTAGNPMTDATSVFVTASDGLRIHARVHGERRSGALPVICLPGLSRNVSDFEELALALAGDRKTPRRVIAIDARGRGRSDRDPDPRNYNPLVELADVLAVMTALSAAPAIVIGTSRGGILAMLMAALRPTALAGVVLNDIGPVLGQQGLMRIMGYVGKLATPRDFEDGAQMLRRLFSAQFTRLAPDDWLRWAKRSWTLQANGRLAPRYDPALSRTLNDVRPEQPPPVMWAQFDALERVPLMAIRGANSDLLTEDTAAAMKSRRPDMTLMTVEGEGHAPLLEGSLIAAIAGFSGQCDAAALSAR
jgi:pimeloyl-ACP methyl ester carboxylesterase